MNIKTRMEDRGPRIATAGLLITVHCSLITGLFAQGPLTPPGPPAPTFKTLEQVEPRVPIATNTTPGDVNNQFIISQPGSYYLTTNIVAVAAKYGIRIQADDVTLDLHGFALIGVAGSLDGVIVSGLRTNIAIRNGTVRSWGNSGVTANGASNCQYQDLRLSANGQWGLNCGFNSAVVNCTAYRNGNTGIEAVTGSTINGCAASLNTGNGIRAADASTVNGCAASYNTGDGIKTSAGSTVTDCSTRSNGGRGIFANDSSTVRGCTAYGNTGVGIETGAGNLVRDCTIGYSQSTGVVAGARCTVRNCTVESNTATGIVAGDGSTVENNTLTANPGGAIVVGSAASVAGNNCSGNGATATGIRATGSENRIDGNNCVGHAIGFKLDSGGNIIVRNTARNNTTANYDLAGGNANGEILNVSVGNTITNVSAWANFSY